MMEMTYRDITFNLNEAEINYAEEYRKNIRMQIEAEDQFRDIYKSYVSMDNAIKKLPEDLINILKEKMKKYVSEWTSQGYYDLDENIFANSYFSKTIEEKLNIEKVYYDLEEKYIDIVMTKEEKEEYRKQRKQSRGRWVGGGFGVGGAISGAATAGAMNMITGLGHSVINAMGNIASSISASNKKSKLYKDSFDILLESLKLDIENLMYANIACSKEKTKKDYHIPTYEDCQKSDAIINNIFDCKLKSQEQNEMIEKLFTLNPYNRRLYYYLLSLYGDSKNQLQEIAKYFGIDTELQTFKHNYMISVYDENPKKTWKDYRDLKKDLRQSMKYYGITKDKKLEELLNNVENKYNVLYKEASTYDNVLYSSPSEAEKMKRESEEIKNIKSTIDYENFDSLEQGLRNLEQFKCKIYAKKIYDIAFIKRKLANIEYSNLENIVLGIDQYNLDSIISALDNVENMQIKYCCKDKFINYLRHNIEIFDENSKKFMEYTFETAQEATNMRNVMQKSISLMENEKYEEAISILKECMIPEVRIKMQQKLQQEANSKLENVIIRGRKYKDNEIKSNLTFKDILVMFLVVMIVGGIASIFIPFAIWIAMIANVLLVIGYVGDKKDYQEKLSKCKNDYEFIMQLNKLGYEFDFNYIDISQNTPIQVPQKNEIRSEEKKKYILNIYKVDDYKTNIIQAIAEVSYLELDEIKEIVSNNSREIKLDLTEDEAKLLSLQLDKSGVNFVMSF